MDVGGVLNTTADRQVLVANDIKSALDFVGLFTESFFVVKDSYKNRCDTGDNENH